MPIEEERGKGEVLSELKDLKESLADTKLVGELVKLAKTLDQAQAVLTFVDAIAEKTLSSTVTLTAARGRGKSAALGLAIAAALAHGYSNIFVTSPSPENLKTLFDFIFKGMDALGFEEHLDYDIAQSTNPDFNKAIVRVNVFRQHRQTIQVRFWLDLFFLSDILSSISNPKMHTSWVRRNWSSLTRQQPSLSHWSAIS
jgi:N-acetyltransferase 10